MSQRPTSTAWLTLDETDNDVEQFLEYGAAALNIGIEIQSPESTLIRVINGIAHDGQPRALILDNFHVITNPEVHRTVAYLLEHLPPNLRLIIAGQTLPSLPMARLRVRGRLNQIRGTELAFSQQETTEFLQPCLLSPSAGSTLLPIMEGWAAGLQFIALASRESDDTDEQAELVRRYVRELVAQEILETQSPDLRAFLLHTAILEDLSPALCDALTGRKDSNAMLESLLTEGHFIRRIGGQIYRYASFFQAALREHLTLTTPEKLSELLDRAASFTHNENGDATSSPSHDPSLSQREHEVLAMLADGLSSPEIARRMIIAVSTVKTHIKHIYRKLDVDNRYQAVKRARELNLLQIEMEERLRRMFR